MGQKLLDGRPVANISAFLFPNDQNADPSRLAGLNALFSQGVNISGQGFLFDDSDPAANFFSTMQSILDEDPSCSQVIKPYIGGEEFNASPSQSFRRYVIDVNQVKEESELSRWPAIENILRTKVKPVRDALGNNPNNDRLKRRWWGFHADRADFYKTLTPLERVLACSIVTPHCAFAFVPSNWVHSYLLNIFAFNSYCAFAILQSGLHGFWARFLGSTALELLRYTPSDCFETFPFPENWQSRPASKPRARLTTSFVPHL